MNTSPIRSRLVIPLKHRLSSRVGGGGYLAGTMLFALLVLSFPAANRAETGEALIPVRIHRLAQGSMQPQTAVGTDGSVHLVYLTGAPEASDVKYAVRPAGSGTFEPAQTVNHQPGSAIAIGTIRGPRLAVSRDGTIHVLWNGSSKAVPQADQSSPVLYSSRRRGDAKFTPERNLLAGAHSLDGGSGVAVGSDGTVYAVWHGRVAGLPEGELNRDIFWRESRDGGVTFGTERRTGVPDGVCGCCSLTTTSTANGGLVFLYRSVGTGTDRDARLRFRTSAEGSFKETVIGPWKTGTCPMSNAALLPVEDRLLAAWERNGRIEVGHFGLTSAPSESRIVPMTGSRQRHPTLTRNAVGTILVAWAEETGWKRGGRVAWQQLSADLKPLGEVGIGANLPVWSSPAVAANSDNSFTVIY